MELSQYFICLLRKGPAYATQMTPEIEDVQARHMAHTQRLMESGAAIAAGPVNDESDIRGFTIFRTATLAEAQALAEADPGVQAGRFVVELHRWLTLAGRLPAPALETP